MNRFIHYVILLMGIFLTLPSSLADTSICEVVKSQQQTVYRRETRTQKVVTYKKCWLFWSCTTYRTMIAYRTTQQLMTKYFFSSVCCDSYVWDQSRLQCVRITDETVSMAPENPSLNSSISPESSLPNNSSSRNQTTNVVLPSTTKLWTSRIPPTSMTTPSNRKGTPKNDSFNMTSSKVPQGAVILISLLLFFVTVIVLSLVLGCVVYRRRKARRIQKETDNLHMEPLRDLQLLSETSSHIQHFSPPFAPDDEYAIVDKKMKDPTPTDGFQQSYENTCIGAKRLANGSGGKDKTKAIIEDVGRDKTQDESNRLTHTYMDGSVCLETNEMTPVSTATVPENSYNEVDDISASKFSSEECYTEVNDMPSSLVCPEGGVQEYDYCYTQFDKSSPSPNACYAEVDDMVPSSGPREGATQQEYEAIRDTYDRLDRGSTPGESDHEKSSKEGDTSGGKYGILVQSSSVDSPESYDTFQGCVSQTDQSGIDGYEPLLAVPSSGSKASELVDADAYDDLDRAMPKTRRMGKDLLDKLRQSTNTGAYGHLGSSFESDISEECSEKISDENPGMEPIYSNQDVPVVSDRDSTYTDMSGCRPGSVVSRSHEKAPEKTYYTTMSPTHQSSNYCNVDLEKQ